ncbi:MAG: lactate utilization protein [Christensenellales bacterium]|jgi:L-lactate utilization protein LutC
MKEKLEQVAKALNGRGFKAQVFGTLKEAKQAALKEIGDASVGFGGSLTVQESGLYEALQQQGNDVYWHWMVSPEEKKDLCESARAADVYVAGSNALTQDGVLVNIDGYGNRTSAMYFGPERVILMIGKNKIVEDVQAALHRLKTVARPLDAKRLNPDLPCVKTGGVCTDCRHKGRICRVTTIFEMPIDERQVVFIYLIDGERGF